MNESLAYFLHAQLHDGSEITLDPDQHGWANPEILKKVAVWWLVPRESGKMPVVTIQIPENGKPVYRSRVYANMKYGISFRVYAIGYKKGNATHWTWVLPTGNIEVGPDPDTAPKILNFLVDQARAAAIQNTPSPENDQPEIAAEVTPPTA